MMRYFSKISFGQPIAAGLEKLPLASFYAKTRGWPFVFAWIHRISGLLMVLYVWAHIYTLSLLTTPAAYDTQMRRFGYLPFSFLEWLLAVPVIFHALNGGRLILYEIFVSRNDQSMIRWVLGLSAVYIFLLGLLMVMGNQSASPIFFWLFAVLFAVLAGYRVGSKIWNIPGFISWKLQRISGAYLFVMIPAHLLFMHLQPAVGHEAQFVIARMQNVFIKFVNLTLVVGVLYHAGYGLLSISRDYLKSRLLQTGLAFLIFVVLAVFGWIGIRLTLTL